MDEYDKILNDYITTHNKNFDVYLVNCEIKIEFDNNFILKLETSYVHKIEFKKLKIFLLYCIDCLKLKGYKFCNINQMTINTINDRCNITYESYMNNPMSMCERKINLNIAKKPQLINSLDRNKNHPLIRKYSHIPFNNK